jgi:hypothetical protein
MADKLDDQLGALYKEVLADERLSRNAEASRGGQSKLRPFKARKRPPVKLRKRG